jgi:hypothetical protein
MRVMAIVFSTLRLCIPIETHNSATRHTPLQKHKHTNHTLTCVCSWKDDGFTVVPRHRPLRHTNSAGQHTHHSKTTRTKNKTRTHVHAYSRSFFYVASPPLLRELKQQNFEYDEVKTLIDQAIDPVLGSNVYQPKKVHGWCSQVGAARVLFSYSFVLFVCVQSNNMCVRLSICFFFCVPSTPVRACTCCTVVIRALLICECAIMCVLCVCSAHLTTIRS